MPGKNAADLMIEFTGNVLANLKKRHESGPIDWSDWLAQLRKMQEGEAKK